MADPLKPPSAAFQAPGQTLGERVKSFIKQARVDAADGITLHEFARLAYGLTRLCVTSIAVFDSPGSEKREFVLNAVGALFDAMASLMVPSIAYPLWKMVAPGVRSVILALASGWIETIYATEVAKPQ